MESIRVDRRGTLSGHPREGILSPIMWYTTTLVCEFRNDPTTGLVGYRPNLFFAFHEIHGSSHPIAFAEDWACFSDKDGVGHAHVRNLKDGREADMLLDTFHGTMFGTFVAPSLSLFVLSDEYGGIRIFDIDKLVLRREQDVQLYCQVPADGPGDPSAWATVDIPDSQYMTALCLSPDGRSLIMLLHHKKDKYSELRMALLPAFPTIHRRRPQQSLPAWTIFQTARSGDILRHCNSLHVLSTNASGDVTFLLGQLESTFWIEVTCKTCHHDRPAVPDLPVPSWLVVDDNRLQEMTRSDVTDTIRARPAAGGVIRKARLARSSLALDEVPADWLDANAVMLLKDEFYSRTTQLAPLVGPATDLILACGVSRPMMFLGGHSDGYHSFWLSATRTPKGHRYFAYAVAEDPEDDEAPSMFRYSDVKAAHALELVSRGLGKSRFKPLHPDAPYIASALEEDITLMTNTRAPAAVRRAAALRLS
ncbi:hypothetical protein CALCODRAFT_507568 [Calocera cornea HHB12733]|uniref:Uncharacterized protein n=1 Tax=Calocera cornea HHB12733 TaxID=1353952 RepID=A0A165HIZ4_9BASI|nr:hypothetical protein CALCODRAFT_507568 [Calocera cornea HHB12733]